MRGVENHQPLIGDAVINDNSSLLLGIEKLPGVNTLEVTCNVDEALAALQPGLPVCPVRFKPLPTGDLHLSPLLILVFGRDHDGSNSFDHRRRY